MKKWDKYLNEIKIMEEIIIKKWNEAEKSYNRLNDNIVSLKISKRGFCILRSSSLKHKVPLEF